MNIEIPGYSIQGELGRGGMATVFLAQQTSLERRVALKVMVPALAADKAFTERFLREGRTVGKLTHPNIIKVFDTGQYQGHYYLAMEYLAGGTLKERMDRGLSPEESLTIIRAVADALAHAHHHGIVHRDIKPQNILFYPSGIPVLSDFGIAKALEGNADFTSFTSTYIGSPRYMSPEQVQGQRIDARADIYALGVLFYEMLTGRALYSATEPFALAYKHVSEPAPPLPAHLKAFQSIMDRLLAKEPDKRFASAEAFIHALDELGATMPPKSPGGATTIDIRRPPRRRHSRLWGAGAGAALLAAAGYAAWQWISGSATPPMPPAGPVAVVAESPTPSDAGSPPEIAPSAVAPLVPPPAPGVPVETPAPPASAAPAAPTLAEGRAGAATEASDNDPVDDDPGYPSVDPGIDQLVAEVEQTMARGDDALALAMVQAGLVAYPHAEILQVLAKTLEGRLAAPPPVAAVATEDRPGKPTQDNTPPPPPPPPPPGGGPEMYRSGGPPR
ncbi:MAG: serine/threonine-protein kinase, partial [Candidatus Competibacterales bacterium]